MSSLPTLKCCCLKETQDVCLTRRFLLGSVFCLDLPREPQGIIACCNPVPPLVRQQVNELHLLVQQAREMPLLKVRRDGASAEGVMPEIFLLVVQSPISEGAPLTQALHIFSPCKLFRRLKLQHRRKRDSRP